jgi:GNAT superfamily N-acetyltransferase
MDVDIADRYAEYLLKHQPIFSRLGAGVARAYAREHISAMPCESIICVDGGSAVALSSLEFDTRLFGLPMGRIDFALGGDAQLLTACFALALERADQRGIEHLFYRAPADATAHVGAAQACGMAVVTNNLYFGRRIDRGEDFASSGTRGAKLEDLPVLLEITREAFSSSTRFHLDPNLSDSAATRLHEVWLKNCLSGERADAVLVADGEQGLSGYITCSLMRGAMEAGSVRVAEIGLFAVSKASRGRGVGGHLMRAVLSWCRSMGVEWVQVDTESINRPAANFYMYSGFSFIGSWFSLHRWHGEKDR